MTAPSQDHPGVITYPPLIFLLCLMIGFGLHVALPWHLGPVLPLRILGIALILLAGGLAGSARATMLKAGTNIRPDKPATAIVSGGPFRHTRNPMYLSLCLLNAGLALVVGWLLPLLMTAVLAAVLHYGVILREEKYLAGKFGSVYLEYCQRVRRWL